MAPQLPGGLLDDVKNYLDITWSDDDTDKKIRNIIALGINYLNKKLGYPADYLRDDEPRALLFEYARYARDGALDVFESNYLSLILSAQNNRKVDLYVSQNAISPEC